MDILPAAPTLARSVQANTTTETSESVANITADFDMFLRLLTTQMRNQDPLNPQESTEYTAQLATFSGVEQQVLTNDLLRDLQSSLAASNMGQLSSWIGLEGRADAPMIYDGTPVTLQGSPSALADRAELVLRNANGDIAAQVPIVLSDQPFSWDGRDGSGFPMAHGQYAASIQSWSGENLIEERSAFVYGEITEAQTIDGEVFLTMRNGSVVPAEAVQAVRERQA